MSKGHLLYSLSIELSKRLDEALNSVDTSQLYPLFRPPLTVYREKLKGICENLILREPLQYGRKAEECLRHRVFCDTIRFCRKRRALLQADKNLLRLYRGHLCAAFSFYHHLIALFVEKSGTIAIDPFFHVNSSSLKGEVKSESNEEGEYYRKAIQRSLINLGDIARYQSEINNNNSEREIAHRCYKMATLLVPESGVALNQLGTLHSNENFGFTSVYYYLYCLACIEVFQGARENLQSLLKINSMDSFCIESEKNGELSFFENHDNEGYTGNRQKFFLWFLRFIEMIIYNKGCADQSIRSAGESVLHYFRTILSDDEPMFSVEHCCQCADPSKLCEVLHFEDVFHSLLVSMMSADVAEKMWRRTHQCKYKTLFFWNCSFLANILRIALTFMISIVLTIIDRITFETISRSIIQNEYHSSSDDSNSTLDLSDEKKSNSIKQCRVLNNYNRSNCNNGNIALNYDSRLEKMTLKWQCTGRNSNCLATTDLFEEMSQVVDIEDETLIDAEYSYDRSTLDAPPGLENDIEVQSAIQLALNLANFNIETDATEISDSEDCQSTIISNSDDSDDSSVGQGNAIHRILNAIIENPLIALINVFFDWVSSNKRYMDYMSKVSFTFWNKMSFLLNLLPHEADLASSGVCKNPRIMKILQQPEMLCSKSWTDIPLSENVELRNMEPVRSRPLSHRLDRINTLSNRDEAILRIICLRRSGYLMAGIFSATSQDEEPCFKYCLETKMFRAKKPQQFEDTGGINPSNGGKPMTKNGSSRNISKSEALAQLRLKNQLNSLKQNYTHGHLLIPELNVIMHSLDKLQAIWRTSRFFILVPNSVVRELDALKKSNQTARKATRWLESNARLENSRVILQRPEEDKNFLQFETGTVEEWNIVQMLNCYQYFVSPCSSDNSKLTFSKTATRLAHIVLDGRKVILLLSTRTESCSDDKQPSRIGRSDEFELRRKAQIVANLLGYKELPQGICVSSCDKVMREFQDT